MFDKSNLGEMSIENEGFKITLKTKTKEVVSYAAAPAPMMMEAPTAAPVASNAAPAPAPTAAAPAAVSGTTMKSPMIGTFYRSGGPDKPVFVKPGDVIKKGQVLCIIEAMKLFNEIEAEMDGKIVKVLVDDASPVEYDQPLFIIE
jgi:acetyl-CoA carboxylase biotin carboxyl carrier protein